MLCLHNSEKGQTYHVKKNSVTQNAYFNHQSRKTHDPSTKSGTTVREYNLDFKQKEMWENNWEGQMKLNG